MKSKSKLSYISEEADNSKDRLKKVKKQLKECQKQKEEYLTQAQRVRADLVNYRRVQEQRFEELKKYSQAELIRNVLPVLDTLTLGSKTSRELEQVKKQLEAILKNAGLVEIDCLGKKFDPQFHEAIDQAESKEKPGTVIEEAQKGYLLHDKVLRPAKVRVAK